MQMHLNFFCNVCTCIAGKRSLFDINLRSNMPQLYAVLVATFFKSLDIDQADLWMSGPQLLSWHAP